MRIAVVGAGLVGRRAASALAASGAERVLLVGRSRQPGPIPNVECRHVESPASVEGVDLAILASESMDQVEIAGQFLQRGASVVATADRPNAVRNLWTMDALATRHGASLVVGAACSPGLSSMLVAQLARDYEHIDAITTARFGTGGPTCAREHHRSMSAPAWQVRGGTGSWARGGSGRHLVWFPEPIGGQDCFRGGLSEPFLLQQAFPTVRRIQSLQAATRRDRATARLPMLRRPHPEGLLGAVWVEVRGQLRPEHGGIVEHRVMSATAPQATAAAAVAVVVAQRVIKDESFASGVSSVLSLSDVPQLLKSVSSDVHLWAHTSEMGVGGGSSGPVRAARKWRGGREK